MSTFSKNLKERRSSLDYSQSELARLVGVHHSIIGRYERDEAKPTIDVLSKLAFALETTVGYLIGENKDADLFKDPGMLERFRQIVSLPDEDRLALLRNVDAFLRDFHTRKAYVAG